MTHLNLNLFLILWVVLSVVGVTLNSLLIWRKQRGVTYANRSRSRTLRILAHDSVMRAVMREFLHVAFGAIGVVAILTPPTKPRPLTWQGVMILVAFTFAQVLIVSDAGIEIINRLRVWRQVKREDG